MDHLHLTKVYSTEKDQYEFVSINGGKYKSNNIKETWNAIDSLYISNPDKLKALQLLESPTISASTLRLDIDLNYDSLPTSRQYSQQQVIGVIKYIFKRFQEISLQSTPYMKLNKRQNKIALVFGKQLSSNQTRDGIHIVFPEVIIDHNLEKTWFTDPLRKYIALNWNTASNNEHVVIDDIMSKPWLVYGSSKGTGYTYVLEHAYNHALEELPLEPYNVPSKIKITNTIDVLSILPVPKTIHNATEKLKKSSREQYTYEDFQRIINALPSSMADDYDIWISVGMACKNIWFSVYGDEDQYFMDYVTFSEKSDKFNFEETKRKWKSFTPRHATLSKLFYLFKTYDETGFQAYRDLTAKILFYKFTLNGYTPQHLINASSSLSDLTAAELRVELDTLIGDKRKLGDPFFAKLYMLFFEDMIKWDPTEREWYRYNNHKWDKVFPIEIFQEMTSLVQDYTLSLYDSIINDINTYKLSLGQDARNYEKIFKEYMKRLNKCKSYIEDKFGTVQKLKGVEDYLKILALDVHFFSVKDSNMKLMGCNNGILDLHNLTFRAGKEDDNITFSTNIDYNIKPDVKDLDEVYEYFNELFANNNDLKENYLDIISSLLIGGNPEKIVFVAYGSTNVGKSQLVQFLHSAFGDYATILPKDLLYASKPDPSKPNPALSDVKGRRVAFVNELSEHEKMNTASVKELSGGDNIKVRALFKNYSPAFIPQFTLYLSCNDLPMIQRKDEAMWNRLKILTFESEFVNHPPKTKEDQYRLRRFPRKINLSDMFKRLAPTLLYVLFERLKDRGTAPLTYCDKINNDTEFMRTGCDPINRFYQEKIHVTDKHVKPIPIDELYLKYKDFCKEDYPSARYIINKSTFKDELINYLKLTVEPIVKNSKKYHVLNIEYTD
jgi:P4 family phage/plasmid primase-like protien